MITKGLIIDEPWISKILNGEKVWEMRSTRSSHRGPFGLIRKGSGQVVGVASLVEVSGPYNSESLAATKDKHCVGAELYGRPDYKWRYAWHMDEIGSLARPVNYQHKNGAVTWVALNQEAVEGISKLMPGIADVEGGVISAVENEMNKLFSGSESLGGIGESTPIKENVMPAYMEASSQPAHIEANLSEKELTEDTNKDIDMAASSKEAISGIEKIAPDVIPIKVEDSAREESLRITLTQGNVNNAHFYIPRHTQLFPKSAWGGKNKLEAGRPVDFHFDGLDRIISTDIDGTKRILRSRGAIKAFFQLHKTNAGDEVHVSRLSEHEFRVKTIKASA